MRVLVTGGAGFIGSRTVAKLVAHDHRVTVISRHPQLSDPDVDRQVTCIACDIRVLDEVVRAVERSRADVIIHVAYALTAAGEADPYFGVAVNVLGTNNVYEAARRAGVRRVIFGSSIAAYAPQAMYGERPVTEDEGILRSESIYGQTKALGEFMAGKFEAKYGVEIPSVRISAVYGSGREARGVTAWTSQMVAAAVAGRPVKVGLRSDQEANFIYVEDSAEQLVRLAEADRLAYRIYNSGGVTSTPGAFARIVKRHCPDAEIRFDEDAPRWPYPHLVDGSRLAREIGLAVRSPETCLLEQIDMERAARVRDASGETPLSSP